MNIEKRVYLNLRNLEEEENSENKILSLVGKDFKFTAKLVLLAINKNSVQFTTVYSEKLANKYSSLKLSKRAKIAYKNIGTISKNFLNNLIPRFTERDQILIKKYAKV